MNTQEIEILEELGVEDCPECGCGVASDWNYKDFSNKNIVICPQCKNEIELAEKEK